MPRPASDGIDVVVDPSADEGVGYRLVVINVGAVKTGQCDTCVHLRGYISWWCTNKTAIGRRKTQMPDASDCPDWAEPPWTIGVIPLLPWWRVAA